MAADVNIPRDFAHAFGNALERFLSEKSMGQTQAAKALGLEKRGHARLHAYLHDRPDGSRPNPDAEILYLLCTRLGFGFEYLGFKITAATLNGAEKRPSPKAAEQSSLDFDRQFDLMEKAGAVRVRVKRPVGRIEVVLSLQAKTS